MKKSELQKFTSWLGKRSYKARLERFGLERLQDIARENGKKGGRPKGSGKLQIKKGKAETDGSLSTETPGNGVEVFHLRGSSTKASASGRALAQLPRRWRKNTRNDARPKWNGAAAGLPTDRKATRIRTVADVIAPYLEGYALCHRPKSVQFSRGRLAQIKKALGNIVLSDLTDERIGSYIRQRQAEKVSGRTINMELGELSRAIGQPWSLLWPRGAETRGAEGRGSCAVTC
jgi:hypothetical protein